MNELVKSEEISKQRKHKQIAIMLCVICLSSLIIIKTPIKQFLAMGIERVFIYIDEFTNTEDIQSEIPQVNDLKMSILNIKDLKNYDKVIKVRDDLYTGSLILVNNEYPCKMDTDKDLVRISEYQNGAYKIMDEDIWVNREMLQHFNRMMEEFKKSTGNHEIIVTSGYRTLREQSKNLQEKIKLYGIEEARNWAMLPGYSEHHTGYAVDISIYTDQGNYIRYRGQDEYGWINENSYKYGIIRRYIGDKKDITGVSNEEWHYRYIGVPHSYIMTAKALCFEEYIEYLKRFTVDKKHLKVKCPEGKYEIYFVPTQGEETEILVPKGTKYSILGNNVDGFIVTVKKEFMRSSNKNTVSLTN